MNWLEPKGKGYKLHKYFSGEAKKLIYLKPEKFEKNVNVICNSGRGAQKIIFKLGPRKIFKGTADATNQSFWTHTHWMRKFMPKKNMGLDVYHVKVFEGHVRDLIPIGLNKIVVCDVNNNFDKYRVGKLCTFSHVFSRNNSYHS